MTTLTRAHAEHTPFPSGHTLTYRECLAPAMAITDEDDARQYLDAYAAYIQRHLNETPRGDDMTATAIAKVNLGYYAGYYDHETRERVERLFSCAHPVFGSASNGAPTAQQAFDAGVAAATGAQS